MALSRAATSLPEARSGQHLPLADDLSPAPQVVNGIAAIVAIQGAGLGVSQAIWSALGVLIAFVWGSLVFSEPIGDLPLAVAGDSSAQKPQSDSQLEGNCSEQLVRATVSTCWTQGLALVRVMNRPKTNRDPSWAPHYRNRPSTPTHTALRMPSPILC